MPKSIFKKYHLNWQPDLPDFRDHRFSAPMAAVLPPAMDLRSDASAITDQGQLGSCTGNAFASMMELLDKRKVHFDFSRLFIYYLEREIEGSVDEDSGAYIRDGIKALAKWGCCSEKLWPYNVEKFAKRPSATAFKEATRHKIKEYQRLDTLIEMKQCLAQRRSFVFGFSVYESFFEASAEKTGIIPMPGQREYLEGGHAIHGVGYDDAKQWIIFQNSWSEAWGDGGFGYMPYAYVTNRNLSDDFWTVIA